MNREYLTGKEALAEIQKRLAAIAEHRREYAATGDMMSGARITLDTLSLMNFLEELNFAAFYEALSGLASQTGRAA